MGESDKTSLVGVMTEAVAHLGGELGDAITSRVEAIGNLTTGVVASAAEELAKAGEVLAEAKAGLRELMERVGNAPLVGTIFREPGQIIANAFNNVDDKVAFSPNATNENHPDHQGFIALIADVLIAGNPTSVSDSKIHQKEFYKHLSGIRGRSGNAVG